MSVSHTLCSPVPPLLLICPFVPKMPAAERPPRGSAMRCYTYGGSIDVDPGRAHWIAGPGPNGERRWNMDEDRNPSTGELPYFDADTTYTQLRLAHDPASIVARRMLKYWCQWRNSTTLARLNANESKELWPDLPGMGGHITTKGPHLGKLEWYAHMATQGIPMKGMSNVWPAVAVMMSRCPSV